MIFRMIKPPYINGAHDQDRTGDLILTKDVLYRLSYVGGLSSLKKPPSLCNYNPHNDRSLPLLIELHPHRRIGNASCQTKLERETGFEPATLSLEG